MSRVPLLARISIMERQEIVNGTKPLVFRFK